LSFLHQISLTQYRNFVAQQFNFEASVVGIAGLNGRGKTNLLDAIYYLCYTKSYFQNKESNNALLGTQGFRIAGKFSNHEVVCKWKEGKKTITCDDLIYEKITEHIGKFASVMIAPDDIALINEGSELRRKFMDGLLSQGDAVYLEHLLQYQKYLSQRNAYLKQCEGVGVDHQLLDVYDAALALHGSYLISARATLSQQLPEWVQHYYTAMSNGSEELSLQYRPSVEAAQLEALLYHSRQRDILYKRTLCGPHTEDWLLTLDDIPLKAHASQGQKKSFLISLKLGQLHCLQQIGQKPFLLLDDIFEKLDRNRLQQLFGLLHSFELAQVFMTHVSATDMKQQISEIYDNAQIVCL
jgi:DNA replication and repair protein RecF